MSYQIKYLQRLVRISRSRGVGFFLTEQKRIQEEQRKINLTDMLKYRDETYWYEDDEDWE